MWTSVASLFTLFYQSRPGAPDLNSCGHRAAYGQDASAGTDYMPHISLLYGDLTMQKKEEIRQTADETVRHKEFVLDTIQVWSTEGVVSEWKQVASFPLAKS